MNLYRRIQLEAGGDMINAKFRSMEKQEAKDRIAFKKIDHIRVDVTRYFNRPEYRIKIDVTLGTYNDPKNII